MKMEQKVDKILESVIRMEEHVERNTKDLSEHIRRTELLECRTDKLESWRDKWAGALKFVSITALVSGVVSGIYAAVSFIGG